jgi:transcriptional regulator with XRE-family HTH domain
MTNTDEFVENAGLIILKMRTKHGLSLRTLSTMTGIESSYLNKMELGKKPVSLKALKRIGDALGYDTKVKVERRKT